MRKIAFILIMLFAVNSAVFAKDKVELNVKACLKDDTFACNKAAAMYETGEGVPINLENAFKYYSLACENKKPNFSGCLGLANAYAQGRGTNEDYTEAVKFYTIACDGSVGEACLILGSMYYQGDVVTQNIEKGIEYYALACDITGNEEACLMSSGDVAEDEGYEEYDETYDEYAAPLDDETLPEVHPDAVLVANKANGAWNDNKFESAVDLFEQACSMGDFPSCRRLGSIYAMGDGGIGEDQELSVRYYKRGCNGKDAYSCVHLTDAYEEIGNYQKAAELYAFACESGVADSCFMLGEYYNVGKGVKQSFEKAAEMYSQACDKYGVTLACYSLGDAYRDGRGVQENAAKAKEYYKKICDEKFEPACNALKKMTK